MRKYTFTIHILGQYLTSSKLFATEEMARQAMENYLSLTWENFPKAKISGFVHLA